MKFDTHENGQIRQAALWFKTSEQRAKAAQAIREVFKNEAVEFGVRFGPLSFKVENLPNPPEPGARVLIGEAVVTEAGKATPIDVQAFKKTVAPSDWKRLQRATLAAYRRAFPGAPDLPLHNIDQLIAGQGLDHIARTHGR